MTDDTGSEDQTRVRRPGFAGPAVAFLALAAALVWTIMNGGKEELVSDQPIRLIVPFGPGGESDTFTRIMQSVIRDEGLLEQPLAIINRGGAGGTIGSRQLKDAEPDGTQLLVLHDGILSAKITGQVEYGPEAFEPIAATGRASSMVCVSNDARWKTLAELLSEAQKSPETIRFGSNLGALSHFGALQLEQTTPGSKFRYVPTGGGAQRFSELIGGHIDVTVFNAGEYVHFRDGGIRALAILAEDRHPDLPDVATAREQGIDAVRTSMQYWWAPKGTPRERIAFFEDLLRRAMQTDAMQSRLSELKMEPVFLTGIELRRELERRELLMRSVRTESKVALPDTALIASLVVLVIGVALTVRRWSTRHLQVPSPADLPPPDVWAGISTFGVLVIFCMLFSLKVASWWILATGFVITLGLLLLRQRARMRGTSISATSIAIVACVAVALGPGCFLLFTRVLTIDLP